MESTCAAHCEQREIFEDLDADNGDTKRTTTQHAKLTRANVQLPPLQQNQPHVRVLFAQKIHSHSTWSFKVIRKHALTSLTPMGRRHLLTIAGSANEEETNSNGEPPSMYRRPACPVNDKREAHRFHTRRNRGNRVEEVGSFTKGGRWTEKRACFIENLSGHNKEVRVDNQSLFQR